MGLIREGSIRKGFGSRLLLSQPRNYAKPGNFYSRNIIRIDIYMVKIDVNKIGLTMNIEEREP